MRHRARYWRGYWNLGPIRIPPLPQGIVLTDRDDGTLWLLSLNVVESSPDDNGHFSITDTIPSNMDTRTFEANDEPYMAENSRVRILIRGGRIGYEIDEPPIGITDRDIGKLMARSGNSSHLAELILPSSWQHDPDVLGWDPVDL